MVHLHMVGGPLQMDLYDYKPVMDKWYDKDVPDSVRMGQRLTAMTSGQARFHIAPSKFKFARHGKSSMWVSGLLPWTATDEFSYNIVKDPVHIRDYHATVLHLLGFDHQRFAVRHQGLDQRLTGVEPARVVKELLA